MDLTFSYLGQTFVWNSDKAALNLTKHGVSFEKACEAFFDPFVHLVDASPKGEARLAAVGLAEDWTLLYVVHLVWENDAIRIISARQATSRERKVYEDHN